MPKRREKSPEEYYKGKLREAQKEIKQLKQEIKQYKKYEQSQDEELPTDSEDTFIPKPVKCNHCGKGELTIFEILGRTFSTCTLCGERKKLS